MFRAILSAIGGYVVMVFLVLAGIAGVWFSMGNQFAFDGDSNQASLKWCLAMLAFGFVASIFGGLFASAAGGVRRLLAVRLLAGLVFVMGILTIVTQFMAEPAVLPEGRKIADLTFVEAGTYAISPLWYNVAIVFVGISGVAIGGQITGRDRS